jgi:Dolichyl-phosphate-mannose-protein mannosyltransferase
MLRQIEPSSTSETRYFLSLLVCLGALLALKLAAVYAARIDLVLDEAQYWTWSRDLAFGYFSKPPMIAWVIRGASDVCGQSEACIRGVSPVLYTLASFMVYLTGRALYGPAVGFWSAIVFDTLPGLSYSSLLITTDVPLILFWTIALYAWAMLVKRQSMGFAILLGLAIGFGLLAKQAMIYAFLCMACHAAVSREARQALKGGRLFVVVLLAFALFTPFLIWNAEHGFPTVKHTGANIGWKPPFIHPIQLVEYFGLQFGVFGPILFAVLLRASWREIRHASDPGKVLLLSFSLPVLALLCVQALISRAHGNWVGDRLSRGNDPRHGGPARAEPAHPVRGVSRPASRDRGDARRGARFRAAATDVRAAPVPVPRRRLARRRRYRARKIGARPLWCAPRRHARDGRRAALLSAGRAHSALCVAARTFAERSVRNDAALHRRDARARPVRLAEALPVEVREIIRRFHQSRDAERDPREREDAYGAFLPPCELQGGVCAGAGSSGALSL